jgi:hypothetical protein
MSCTLCLIFSFEDYITILRITHSKIVSIFILCGSKLQQTQKIKELIFNISGFHKFSH